MRRWSAGLPLVHARDTRGTSEAIAGSPGRNSLVGNSEFLILNAKLRETKFRTQHSEFSIAVLNRLLNDLVHRRRELVLAAWALEEFTSALCPLRPEPVVVADRTIDVDWLVIAKEVALWIVRATPEGALELTTAALDEIAGVTLRTLDTAWDRASILAVRIALASDEAAKAR